MATYLFEGSCKTDEEILSGTFSDTSLLSVSATQFILETNPAITIVSSVPYFQRNYQVYNYHPYVIAHAGLSQTSRLYVCDPADYADELSFYDQMTPQLAGAMSLATAVLWGGAWAWRITRALS